MSRHSSFLKMELGIVGTRITGLLTGKVWLRGRALWKDIVSSRSIGRRIELPASCQARRRVQVKANSPDHPVVVPFWTEMSWWQSQESATGVMCALVVLFGIKERGWCRRAEKRVGEKGRKENVTRQALPKTKNPVNRKCGLLEVLALVWFLSSTTTRTFLLDERIFFHLLLRGSFSVE